MTCININTIFSPLFFQIMKNQVLYTVLSLFAVCIAWSFAAPAASQDAAPNKDEALFLARLLRPVRDLSNQASQIEALIEDAVRKGLPTKRQSAGWDMDYGWGGGRFGKRAESKRYDMYGMGGRFGRDVDHIDTENNNNNNVH